jgi:multiple sugar transport system ATP-binding protein
MAFGLRLRGTARGRIGEKVNAAAQMLGIEQLLNRRPSALSGGQRQRVALGRAVVREPQCFLMDEPLSNLDAKLRVQTRAELIRLHKRLGITTVYVTHDQAEAMTMGDRIAVMKDGLIQQCDTPMELFERPANRFVAGFIGSPPMNFLPAVLEHVDGAVWASGEGFRAPLDAFDGLDGQAGREVVIGLRPTDMRPAGAAGGSAERVGRLEGVVDVTEPMGPTTLIYLQVGGESVIVSVEGSEQVPESGPFCVEFDGDRCHVFDPDDGRNLCLSPGARPTQAGR